MKQITNYELGITNSEGLTPAMERWAGLLERGYSIRPVIARSSYRGTVWRPGLFNPEGGYVQRVRVDTVRKLVGLGLVEEQGGRGAGEQGGEEVDIVDGVDAAAGMDGHDDAGAGGGRTGVRGGRTGVRGGRTGVRGGVDRDSE